MLEKLYILFWIYAIAGYLMEVIRVLLSKHKFVNRGFLLGPYCPIYGVGGVLLSLISGYTKEPLIVFLISIVICSIVEYLASYILELIYKVRWWDYSNKPFNVNGRICLTYTIAFGVLGMIIVCYLNPILIGFIDSFNIYFRHILVIIMMIITTLDIIITSTILFDIRSTVTNYKNKTLNIFKDSTEEISKKVRNILKDKSFLHKHVFNAFSNIRIYTSNILQKTSDFIKYRKIEDIYMITLLISFVVGLIAGLITKEIGLSLALAIALGLFISLIISRGVNGK